MLDDVFPFWSCGYCASAGCRIPTPLPRLYSSGVVVTFVYCWQHKGGDMMKVRAVLVSGAYAVVNRSSLSNTYTDVVLELW